MGYAFFWIPCSGVFHTFTIILINRYRLSILYILLVGGFMTLDTIKKAALAMINKKEVSSYDLPKSIKSKIASRTYSASEINKAYKKSNTIG